MSMRWLPALALVVLAGCSGDTRGTVAGRVTVGGVPVQGGMIRFVPLDGKSPAEGSVIADGAYSARVAPGETRVEITSPRPARPGKVPPRVMASEKPLEEALPERYNLRSELTLSVKPGFNPKDWALDAE